MQNYFTLQVISTPHAPHLMLIICDHSFKNKPCKKWWVFLIWHSMGVDCEVWDVFGLTDCPIWGLSDMLDVRIHRVCKTSARQWIISIHNHSAKTAYIISSFDPLCISIKHTADKMWLFVYRHTFIINQSQANECKSWNRQKLNQFSGPFYSYHK